MNSLVQIMFADFGFNEFSCPLILTRTLDKREYLVIIRDNSLHKTICCDPSSEPS